MSGSGPERQPRVPIEPLIRALVARGVVEPEHRIAEIARAIGFSREVTSRAIRTGEITIFAADQAATRALHVHPSTIWGDDWLDAESIRAGDRSARIDAAFEQLRNEVPA